MATLSAGGIGSGLDVNGIIAKLMVLERRPLDNILSLKSDLNAQLSAYGQLKSAFSTFETSMQKLSSATSFQIYSATSSNESAFTATASSSAVPGSYTIDVTQLAKAEKMVSTSSFATADTAIGTEGAVDISVGGSTFQINIVSGVNNTLNGIKDEINNAAGNTGVTASIINVDDGGGGTVSKLVLTADNAGAANTITMTDVGAPPFNHVAADLGMATVTAGQDASITVDGFTVTSTTNTIVDAVAGVTINLKDVTATPATLTIDRDKAAIKDNIQTFVNAYNDVRSTLRTLGGKDATLQGESSLLSLERKLQNVLNSAAGGLNYKYLAEIGITTSSKDGSLSIDSTKLDAALNSNLSDVADLFANSTEGFAVRFEAMAKNVTGSGSPITSRQDGINARIGSLENQEQKLAYRLEIVEERYRIQFTALDSLVAQLNTTGNFLAQQLAGLPTIKR